MKKYLIALALFCGAFFTPAQAQLTGWGYLNSFPWMYLEDESSWAYLFVVDDGYWAYVQETGDYIYAGEVETGGDAPSSVVGAVFTLSVVDDGVYGTGTFTFNTDTEVHVVVVIGEETFEETGTYQYQQQGADSALFTVEIEDEGDVVDSLFSLIFSDPNYGYYLSLSSDEEELPVAGEDGQYGQFTAVYSTAE